jgi:3-methyladenine DNA glycosylase AlkD
LRALANPAVASHSARFFKTGPGEYGEGDRFLGITVPVIREEVREFFGTPLPEVVKLLKSPVHEERLLALLLFVKKYEKGEGGLKKKICTLYLRNTRYINNWDLIDLTAEKIVGPFLADGKRRPLYHLAKSKSLWERRIAILSTFHFIKNHEFSDTLKISRMLLTDEHDLIHKAVGWMLREVGKRDTSTLESFLRRHYQAMPRTMLRYAIERFPEAKRKKYLNGSI